VPGARYVVESAQGKIYTGVLDGQGKARVKIPPGPSKVTFPDYDAAGVTKQS